MVDAGLVVLVSFISPFRAERRLARDRVEDGEFIEVHVDTPLAVAEERDPKGLYAKARRGELANFTGIDSPYEAPEHPEVRVDTGATTAEEAAEGIVAALRERGHHQLIYAAAVRLCDEPTDRGVDRSLIAAGDGADAGDAMMSRCTTRSCTTSTTRSPSSR